MKKIAALLSLLATLTTASLSFADCVCVDDAEGRLSRGTILLIINERVHGDPVLATFKYDGLENKKIAQQQCQRKMRSTIACLYNDNDMYLE